MLSLAHEGPKNSHVLPRHRCDCSWVKEQGQGILQKVEIRFTKITESQVGRDLSDHLAQPFWEEPSLDKMAQHPVQTTLDGVQHGRVNHIPGEIIPTVTVLSVKNFPLVPNRNLPKSNLCPSPLSSLWDSV